MNSIFLSIIIATLAIQIPNIWAINYFQQQSDILGALKIAVFTMPTGLLATAGYAYFYGKGTAVFPYPILAIMAYGISLLTATFVQIVLVGKFQLAPTDLAGSGLVVLGLLVAIAGKF